MFIGPNIVVITEE